MTGEPDNSHGVRKRSDRNQTSGNADAKEVETEPVSTENIGGDDKRSETFASRTESVSSDSAKGEGHLDHTREAPLREAIQRALKRDELLRRNRKARATQMCVSVLGMVCLGWPSLLLFDLVLILLPFNHVEALQYSSQETSFVGVASRLCLKVVKIARTAQIANKEYHGVITFACLAFLAFLLYVVRVTTKTQKVMSFAERQIFKEMVRKLGKAHLSEAIRTADRAPSLE